MLSSLCDELRMIAARVSDGIGEGGLAVSPEVCIIWSAVMRSAADTIWELRCKLNGTYYWTADEVRELVSRNDHKGWNIYSDGINWDAIADTLNFREPRNREDA